MSDWRIYKGTGEPHNGIDHLPAPPHWRMFHHVLDADKTSLKYQKFQVDPKERDLVNAAMLLRRPLLISGRPGTGKSSLAHAVAHELQLGRVLVWPITSRSTLHEALYRYDAIGRLQEASLRRENAADQPPEIGRFIRLGPVGTALLPSTRPRVLLIDEIDKSDIDLPNDLLNIFEEGQFEIPELARLPKEQAEVSVFRYDSEDLVTLRRGQVVCTEFPFVVITSNGERELPPAFLRRCLRLDITEPNPKKLAKIVEAHFDMEDINQAPQLAALLERFIQRRDNGYMATDQLLNAIHLTNQGVNLDAVIDDSDDGTEQDDADSERKERLIDFVLRYLSTLGGR